MSFLRENIFDTVSVEKVRLDKPSLTSLKPPKKNVISCFSSTLFSWVLREFTYVRRAMRTNLKLKI